jgi:hypothetical protein
MDNIENAPDLTTIQNYISELDKGQGPAKASRYAVQIFLPHGFAISAVPPYDTKPLSYLCEQAELPGRGFMHTAIRYYGPQFTAPLLSEYSDVAFTFLIRNDFKERELFDDWMDFINPINTYNFRYRKDYVALIEIFALTDFLAPVKTTPAGPSDPDSEPIPVKAPPQYKPVYKFNLEDAWPVSVSSQPLLYADDNFHRLTVTFNYRRWYRRDEDIDTTAFNLTESMTETVRPL